ncbi:MAG: hypothetical protein R2778_09940 [Saprospiraceae bacterium]
MPQVITTFTVTNTTNGCTSTDFATVVLDNSTPSADAGSNLTITCANSTTGVDINSSGSSSGPEFTFFWTGPGINASNEKCSKSYCTCGWNIYARSYQ